MATWLSNFAMATWLSIINEEALQLERLIYLSTIVLPYGFYSYAATCIDEDSAGKENLAEQLSHNLSKKIISFNRVKLPS